MKLLVLAGLLGASTWTPPSDRQFDAVCGDFQYRIDLNVGRWCANECKQLRKVARVDGDMLVLRESNPTADRQIIQYTRINLKTNTLEAEFATVGEKLSPTSTPCRSASFSGFPAGSYDI